MPIYEYRCRKCGTGFESLVFGRADEVSVCCPGCGGADVEKQLSCFSTSNASASDRGAQCAPKPGSRFG